MQTLVIVESPAKAKTIEKYLGKGYVVKASVGHIRDLPKSNKNAIDIQAGFVPNYEVVQKKQDIIKELSAYAKKSDKVLLATDRDREGEAIAWHLVEALKLPKEKTKRIAFNEITKEAVQEAIKHPRDIDQNLRKAQEARRVLDRLVGYDLSGLIWKKVRYGLSAGRVQSPALRILMEREREIRAFIPEAYWVLTANVVSHDYTFSLTCTEEPKEEAEANRIVAVAKEGLWSVKEVKESEQKRAPRPPFTTSTLQQTASTRLGFSPSKTMAVAQKLYEAGHITYMRTDSLTLSEAALGMLSSVIEKNFGKAFIEIKKYKTKSKNAQEAHEAIRPTNPVKIRAGSTDEQKRLYNLIWMRTVASQMKSAQLAKTKILANIAGGTIPDFAVRGSRVVYDGWLKADPDIRVTRLH
ncbi:MAG: topoisomerase protein [Parcubacteria group bacterium GW2011_GWC2_42_11]|nr:MAG: topoisomerase protein [Parcubacteria group bacterium GW2011_GWC2_42_11]